MNPMLEHDTTATTILIVEDNPSARIALEALLDALGYTVLAAGDGAEALAVFGEHADTIDLVMSDLILPQLGGPEVCAKLRAAKPGLPCVIMSGYPLEDESDRLRRLGITHWLQKPFNMRQLDELLRTLLQE
jgi:two-component system cell cycle sensor histidine kinase/response regulator CckA